jgi:hypothetical protein
LPRVLRRLEFHYTPKQVNWLNMVEIELGALKGQRLDRHVESRDRLVAEIGARQVQRNKTAPASPGCLYRQSQNQNGAHLSQSLAQRVIITVRGN